MVELSKGYEERYARLTGTLPKDQASLHPDGKQWETRTQQVDTELIPFLKDHSIDYVARAAGCVFVDGEYADHMLALSIQAHGISNEYDILLFDRKKFVHNEFLLPQRGYNPKREFVNLEELQHEILFFTKQR